MSNEETRAREAASTLEATHGPVAEHLSPAASARVRHVLRYMPAYAVTEQFVPLEEPLSITRLVRQVATLGDALSTALQQREQVEEELRTLQRDLATFRRVLGTDGGAA